MGLDVPVFEIARSRAGERPSGAQRELGVALAKVLSDKTVVLMRGHGSVTVGTRSRRSCSAPIMPR